MPTNGSDRKRIRVFDEDGREIGLTYPKRARGMIKKGRARWGTISAAATEQNANPDTEPDSLILIAAADFPKEAPAATHNETEDNAMSENNERNNEERIHDMIEKFRAEMARARQIAEQAAREAEAAMEKARAEAEERSRAFAEEDSLAKRAGEKLGEAVEAIRETAEKIGENETVKKIGEDVKAAGSAVLEEARKKLEDAEAHLEEARRTYEEAEREAEEEVPADDPETPEDESDPGEGIRQNMKTIAAEASDAMKVAWNELKRGWSELKSASAGSLTWLKTEAGHAKDDLRGVCHDVKDSVRSFMAGDGKAEKDEEETVFPNFDTDDEECFEDKCSESESARSARENIENEMSVVQDQYEEMLDAVKAAYEAGSIDVEKYLDAKNKYLEAMHARLTELRQELLTL